MRIAHHAHYLTWFEIGRTEWMRAAGLPYRTLEERDRLSFPVIELAVNYRHPARYDDLLEVRTRVDELRRSRIRFSYRIVRQDDQKLLAEGHSVHACTDGAGKPTRTPRAVMEVLAT